VISQDFVSPKLKHNKHWNSFTTEFFKDVEEIEKLLEERGEIKVFFMNVVLTNDFYLFCFIYLFNK
jgi:aprataxin